MCVCVYKQYICLHYIIDVLHNDADLIVYLLRRSGEGNISERGNHQRHLASRLSSRGLYTCVHMCVYVCVCVKADFIMRFLLKNTYF